MSRSVIVRRATAVLVIAVLPALGACTGRQRQVSYPISAERAAAVVRSYAADWALVVSRRDRDALRPIQAGDALRATAAQLEALEGTGGASPAAPRASEIKVFVAPSGSPRSAASFLALVTWTSPETYPEPEALEFRRVSPDGPWRAELRARLINNTPPPTIVTDRGGGAGMVDARRTKKLRFSGEQVVETLSGYYSDGEGSDALVSRSDTLVAPGPFTSGLVKRRKQSNESFQIQHQREYRPGRYPTMAYLLGDGGGLMLVSLEGTRHMFTKEPTLVTLQQDASREGLGGLVPPGQYSSLIFQTITMLAVEVPPAKSRRPLRVVGWREIDLSVDTTPA
jgi:hypothetical protein